MGPVLLLPGRQIHVKLSKYTKLTQFSQSRQMMGDLHACVAALPMAIQNNASEIVVEVQGERPRTHKAQDAIAHLKRNPLELAPYLNGFGNVEDPRFGINLAPGNYMPALQLVVERQRRQQHAGVILPA